MCTKPQQNCGLDEAASYAELRKGQAIYARAIARCYLSAPENSEEQGLLARALEAATKRINLEPVAIVREEVNNIARTEL